MAKWQVSYSDPESGKGAEKVIEAPSWGAAKQAAGKAGIKQPRAIKRIDEDTPISQDPPLVDEPVVDEPVVEGDDPHAGESNTTPGAA